MNDFIPLINIAKSCLNCKIANCSKQCALKMPISEITNLVKIEKFEEAAELIFTYNPFPFVTGSLCDFNRKCHSSCVLNKSVGPVLFNQIERELGNKFYEKNFYKNYNNDSLKVAIIGGGIAGLSVAIELIHAGIRPTIFEKNDHLGGVITSSLPQFRFNYFEVFKKTLKFIESNSNIFYEKEFGRNLLIDDLKSFDEVVLAIGSMIPRKVLPQNLVYQAIDLLENEAKREKIVNKTILVIGCGNVAIDIARTMKRQNNDVKIVYRRDISNSPASKNEIEEAMKEQISFNECLSPVEIKENVNSEFKYTLRCEKLELFDDGGSRLNFRSTGIFEEIKGDVIIEALGSIVDYEYLKMVYGTIFDEKGYIKVDDNFETEIRGLYVIGDALTGPKDFNSAISAGLISSKHIIKKNEFSSVMDLVTNKVVAFGGSFNPPTIAHRAIIDSILKLNPQKLIIIPNGDNYHTEFDKKKLASFNDRFKMCELLVDDLDHEVVEISNIENKMQFMGIAKTLDELDHPTFIMGSDCITNLSKWIEYERLIKENKFVIFTRGSSDKEIKKEILDDKYLRKYIDHFSIMQLNLSYVSSSNFRNKNDKEIVNKKIEHYINEHKLYEVNNAE